MNSCWLLFESLVPFMFSSSASVYWDWSRLLITDRDYWSLIPAQFWHLNHIFSVQQTEFPLIFIALMLSFHSMQMRSKILWGAVRLIYSYIKLHAAMLYMCYLWFFGSNGQSSIMPALQIWTSSSPYKPPFITSCKPLQHTRLACLPERLLDVQLMLCQIDIILETFYEKIMG